MHWPTGPVMDQLDGEYAMFSLRITAMCAALVLSAAACGDGTKTTEPDANPTPAPVARLVVTPATATLSAGQTRQLTVTLYSAANAVLTGRAVAYATNAAAVATVTQAGVVTAVANGQAKITITSEGKTAEATITVQPAVVASVEINPEDIAIDAGESITAQAVARDAQNNVLPGREATWFINKPEVATVDANGKIVGIKPGLAILQATIDGRSSQTNVVVRAVVASVEIVGHLDTLEMYEFRNLTAIARDADGAIIPNVPFTWESSHPNIVPVDGNGRVNGFNRGTAQIAATAPNGKFDVVTRVVVIRYRSMTLGTAHACNIASGGIAWCWGLNSVDGRIGLPQVGDGVHRTAPIIVPGDHRFVQLVTYSRTTCGLRQDGMAYCWGTNGWGALGSGTNVGFSSTPVAVAGNHTFTKLVAGAEHACGLTPAGSLYCWGANSWGQFGTGNTTNASAPVLAAGGMQFADVSAGSTNTCGVTNTGAAYCWGGNTYGQLGIGGQIPYGNVYKNTPQAVVGGHTFASIIVAEGFTCALTAAGQAYCWGLDGRRLGSGNAGDVSSPRAVNGGHTFIDLDAGFGHGCGVTAQNDVYCWGTNSYGQLGSAGAFANNPTLVTGGLKAAEVDVAGIGTGSAGFTCAIAKDRLTTWCWGRNDVGQLGNGMTNVPASVNYTPTIVSGQKPL